MAPGSYSVAHEGGIWVTTDNGPVHLEQGETLPENVHVDEVARLANGGVLEGIDQAPELVDLGSDGDEIPATLPAGGVDEIKTRVGSDAELAQAYLDQENAREKPRATLVAHLEQVLADDAHRVDPGTPPAGDESAEA